MAEEVYVGIDVSKAELVVAVRPSAECVTLSNNPAGIRRLVAKLRELKPQLVAIEATGGLQRQVVFMIVSIAVPYMAAGIAGGTIGLALSHAFEAAFITQTVIRPITSALQNGFKMVGRLGRVAGEREDAEAWLNTVDPTRVTRRLDNVDPKTNQRVPAPNPHATSVTPARAPKTTFIDPATAGLKNGKTMTVSVDEATKRF